MDRIWPDRARGLDNRPIETDRETKSISQEITFAHDISDGEELQRTLRRLSEGVGRHLRNQNLSAATIKLKLRWPDFTTITRQMTLAQPTCLDEDIQAVARQLFDSVWTQGKPVRLLGVGTSGLTAGYRQLGLWEQDEAESQQLQNTLDDLRHRFGPGVIWTSLRSGDTMNTARHMLTFDLPPRGHFTHRAVAVFVHNERVLIHRAESDDFWALPGGRVELGEAAASTIVREMNEELHEQVRVERLLWVVENFFNYVGRDYHELGLYFLTSFPAASELAERTTPFWGDEEGVRLIFQWAPIAELPSLPLYPSFLRHALADLPAGPTHVVHIDTSQQGKAASTAP